VKTKHFLFKKTCPKDAVIPALGQAYHHDRDRNTRHAERRK